MRDVEYLEVKGHFNFKALTERAKEKMGREIGGPWHMAADVFFMHVPAEKFEATVKRLQGMGLQTEADPTPADIIRSLTEF